MKSENLSKSSLNSIEKCSPERKLEMSSHGIEPETIDEDLLNVSLEDILEDSLQLLDEIDSKSFSKIGGNQTSNQSNEDLIKNDDKPQTLTGSSASSSQCSTNDPSKLDNVAKKPTVINSNKGKATANQNGAKKWPAKKFRCRQCKYGATREELLINHVEKIHPIKVISPLDEKDQKHKSSSIDETILAIKNVEEKDQKSKTDSVNEKYQKAKTDSTNESERTPRGRLSTGMAIFKRQRVAEKENSDEKLNFKKCRRSQLDNDSTLETIDISGDSEKDISVTTDLSVAKETDASTATKLLPETVAVTENKSKSQDIDQVAERSLETPPNKSETEKQQDTGDLSLQTGQEKDNNRQLTLPLEAQEETKDNNDSTSPDNSKSAGTTSNDKMRTETEIIFFEESEMVDLTDENSESETNSINEENPNDPQPSIEKSLQKDLIKVGEVQTVKDFPPDLFKCVVKLKEISPDQIQETKQKRNRRSGLTMLMNDFDKIADPFKVETSPKRMTRTRKRTSTEGGFLSLESINKKMREKDLESFCQTEKESSGLIDVLGKYFKNILCLNIVI
jgi:hypothetical protein